MVKNGSSEYELELRLIGPVRLLRRDGTSVTPKGRKAQGLLALLGVSAGYRQSRSAIQDKLWSDRGAEQGGASLRQELRGLRQALGELRDCLISEGVWVALDPARVHVVLEPGPDDWDLTGSPPEFAAGLDIADPEFEHWIRDCRARFADRFAEQPPPPAPLPAAPLATLPAMAADPAPGPERPSLVIAPFDSSPSIAVMPVTFHGADMDEAGFLGAGLVTDVIRRLTRFRRLDVIAYASTAALAPLNLTPRQIGERLGVRYITQGVLWLGRGRLRLSFDLINAETEVVMWSQQFDRSFEDFFEVEGEIVGEIAAEVMTEIDQQERARVRARDPNSLDAYELCLRGLDEMLRLDRAGCDNALLYFTRAEERERRYARALSGISRAHGFYWKYRWAADRDEALERADTFAVEAVDADVNDAGASAALGWVALYSRKHERALAAYTRAMELNPSDADILAEYADALRHSGSPEEAIPIFGRAIRLNPQMADIYAKDLAGALLVSGRYDEAIRTIERMRRPQIANLVLAAAYALAGRDDAALRTADTVRSTIPNFSPEAWVTMVPNRNEDHTAIFLDGLKRAGL